MSEAQLRRPGPKAAIARVVQTAIDIKPHDSRLVDVSCALICDTATGERLHRWLNDQLIDGSDISDALVSLLPRALLLEVRIPQLVPLGSAPNRREHWAKKASRGKRERAQALLVLGARKPPRPPCLVTIIRCAPTLVRDSDNLTAMGKFVRDACAEWMGIDDGDPGVTWVIEQKRIARNRQGTIVRIEARSP